MHQYFLQITEHLEDKGYKKLNPGSNNVYGRVDCDVVYVVVLGSGMNLTSDSLRRFNNKIIFDLKNNTGMRIELINLLFTKNGMFDDGIKELVNNLDNVWLFSEDYGNLYIFENQPDDFDGLHEILDKKIHKEQDKITIRIKKLFGVVTPCIVLLNIIVYIVMVFTKNRYEESVVITKLALSLPDVIEKRQFYRIFTAMFVHFSITHILSNMVILLALGARIENMIGKTGYIISYVLCGMVASVASLISCYYGNLYDYAGGASGAIFGLMGIMIVIAFAKKGNVSGISLWNLIVLSVLTILNGYVSEGIDNVAHIGGLIAGVVAGIILIMTHVIVVKEEPM